MTAATRLPVPPLGPTVPMSVPATAELRLPTSARVVAARHAGVPMVEVRLRIPFGSAAPGHASRARLLADTLLAGSGPSTRLDLAERLQEIGAGLSAVADPDMLLISGSVTAAHLDDLLELLTDVLTAARYPEHEVDAERERLLRRLSMARSQAGVRAAETLRRHLFGGHPYGEVLPQLDDLAAVQAGELRALHAERVVPDGATLVLVGDLDPQRVVARAGEILGRWTGAAPAESTTAVPPLVADPSLLVHRPGSVQSSIRIGGDAPRRQDPLYPAMQLTNLLYCGYFSSRLVANIREDKGYTYSPRSRIEHASAASTLVAEADVATGVTAPALLEMWYELGRLSTLRPTGQELDEARQYAVGTLAMSLVTQSGVADTLVSLVGVGLDLSWVQDHPARLAAVTADDVYHIGVHILAPNRLAAVVIGDGTQIAQPLKAFGPWEVRE